MLIKAMPIPEISKQKVACTQCGEVTVEEGYWPHCDRCEAKYGHHLLKSTIDEFDYAMRLVSGDLIYYNHATIEGDWVRVSDEGIVPMRGFLSVSCAPPTPNPPFERGLQIRLDAIAWVADAPFGS